jgi:hypothetical protein
LGLRDLDLPELAGSYVRHSHLDQEGRCFDSTPFIRGKLHNRDGIPGQVLLILEALIGGDEDTKLPFRPA